VTLSKVHVSQIQRTRTSIDIMEVRFLFCFSGRDEDRGSKPAWANTS
jgi:hypothetical protein